MQQGLPELRLVFVPQPVMGKSPVELRAYVDGPDAVTGRPFMEEVIDALKRVYQTLFRSKLRLEEAIAQMEAQVGHIEEASYFLEFVRSSKRGVCR